MGNKKKNNSFLTQGVLIAAATMIARIIGLVYRIPLTNILGDEGNSYYSASIEIFTILLIITSFGLPQVVSRLVSERLQMGQTKNAYRVFCCSLKFAVVTGGVLSLFTILLAGVVSKYIMHMELAAYGLRILAPAILIFAVIGAFRGFFQGHGTIIPSKAALAMEHIVTAVVSVVCASLLFQYAVKRGKGASDSAYGAAGGAIGIVAGGVIVLLFFVLLYLFYKGSIKRQMRHDPTRRLEANAVIYMEMLIMLLPIVLSTIVFSIVTVLDQGIFNAVLLGQGFAENQYNMIWGIYVGKFRVLMNIPLVLVSCMIPAVVTTLSGAMEGDDYSDAYKKVRSAIRYTMVITIPCAVVMLALASPIMLLLFHDSMPLSAGLMQSGALMLVLFALSALTTGVLHGLNQMRRSMVHTLIALVLHILVLLLLLTKSSLNIYSVVFANILFSLVVCILNMLFIKKYLNYHQEIKRTFLIPLISSGIMGIVIYGMHWLVNLLTGNTFATLVAIAIGVIVYAICMVKLKGVREREIMNLPLGSHMLILLRRCHIL